MNEDMKAAWIEIAQMLGEPSREELDVFLRAWQRATEAHKKALAEQPTYQGVKTFHEGKPIYVAVQPAQQEQHISELTKVEEAILGYWGERCSTFESECPVCQAWAEFEIKTALGPKCYPPLKPLPKKKL